MDDYVRRGELYAWQMHPDETDFASRLLGQAARDVLRRADYFVTNIEQWVRNSGEGHRALDLWFVQSNLKKNLRQRPNPEYFSVDRNGWISCDRYAKLAQAIEEIKGRHGFTVLIYPSPQPSGI